MYARLQFLAARMSNCELEHEKNAPRGLSVRTYSDGSMHIAQLIFVWRFADRNRVFKTQGWCACQVAGIEASPGPQTLFFQLATA